jgi:hypothetical protein
MTHHNQTKLLTTCSLNFSKDKVVNQVHGAMDQVQGSSARGLWLSLNENRSSAGQGPGFNISEGGIQPHNHSRRSGDGQQGLNMPKRYAHLNHSGSARSPAHDDAIGALHQS